MAVGQGREASKQSHVSSMIHGSVLARTSLEDAVTCDVGNKMATTFLSATEVNMCFFIMSLLLQPSTGVRLWTFTKIKWFCGLYYNQLVGASLKTKKRERSRGFPV